MVATAEAKESNSLVATRRTLTKLGINNVAANGGFPVFLGKGWHWLYTQRFVPEGVENVADPVAVEAIRREVELICTTGAPMTRQNLEEAGYRSANSILTKPIKTQADVVRWAESIFNWGPAYPHEEHFPRRIAPLDVLVPEHLQVWHVTEDGPVVVVPAGQPGSGDTRVRVLHAPPITSWARDLAKGKTVILGPRHEISKVTFAGTAETPETPQERPKRVAAATKTRKATKAVAGEVRHVGRPRKDGLATGGPEVKILKECYENKEPVPEFVLALMTYEARMKEEARNARLGGQVVPKVPRKPSARKSRKVAKSNVVPIKAAPAKRRFRPIAQ